MHYVIHNAYNYTYVVGTQVHCLVQMYKVGIRDMFQLLQQLIPVFHRVQAIAHSFAKFYALQLHRSTDDPRIAARAPIHYLAGTCILPRCYPQKTYTTSL